MHVKRRTPDRAKHVIRRIVDSSWMIYGEQVKRNFRAGWSMDQLPRFRGGWRRLKPVSSRVILVAIGVLAPADLLAQNVTFDDAIALSQQFPEVRGTKSQLRTRKELDKDVGGTAQQTQVVLMPGARLSPQSSRGFEFQGNLYQSWNLANLSGARRRSAKHERSEMAVLLRAQAMNARVQAALCWLELNMIEALEQNVIRDQQLAEVLVESYQRAFEAGAATRIDVEEARNYQGELALHRLDLKSERFNQSLRLSVLMDRTPSGKLVTAGQVPNPDLPSSSELHRAIVDLDQLPQVRRQHFAALVAKAHRIEASANMAPSLTLGTQIQTESPTSWLVFGSAGITASFFDQNQRQQSVSQAAYDKAKIDAEGELKNARADFESAIHDLGHTQEQLDAYKQTLLPAIQTIVAKTKRALQAGEATVFQLVHAQRRAIVAREQYLRIYKEQRWNRVKLWLLLAELRKAKNE